MKVIRQYLKVVTGVTFSQNRKTGHGIYSMMLCTKAMKSNHLKYWTKPLLESYTYIPV
jgi:hypothetical protein